MLINEQPKKLKRSESELKKAKKELHESEEKYRSLFEGSLHPVTIYDRNANLVMLNKIGAKNLKKSLHEIIGKPTVIPLPYPFKGCNKVEFAVRNWEVQLL